MINGTVRSMCLIKHRVYDCAPLQTLCSERCEPLAVVMSPSLEAGSVRSLAIFRLHIHQHEPGCLNKPNWLQPVFLCCCSKMFYRSVSLVSAAEETRRVAARLPLIACARSFSFRDVG